MNGSLTVWPSDTIWRHISGSTLVRVMAWCRQATSHYLNQIWLIVSTDQWHLSESNFIRDTPATNHKNQLQFAWIKFLSNLPGANDLIIIFSLDWSLDGKGHSMLTFICRMEPNITSSSGSTGPMLSTRGSPSPTWDVQIWCRSSTASTRLGTLPPWANYCPSRCRTMMRARKLPLIISTKESSSPQNPWHRWSS